MKAGIINPQPLRSGLWPQLLPWADLLHVCVEHWAHDPCGVAAGAGRVGPQSRLWVTEPPDPLRAEYAVASRSYGWGRCLIASSIQLYNMGCSAAACAVCPSVCNCMLITSQCLGVSACLPLSSA